MPTTEVKDRLKELRTALDVKVKANDEILASIDVNADGEGGIAMSEEQVTTFRKNLADGEEMKAQIALLEGQVGLGQFLDGAPEGAEALKAAAANAAGIRSPRIRKTLGELFTGSEEFKRFREMGGYTMQQSWEIDGIDLGSAWTPRDAGRIVGDPGQKDIWTGPDIAGDWSGAPGYAADIPFGMNPIQVDPMIPLPQRRVRVRDLFPVQQTTAAVIEFFRVTGFVNNASVVPDRDTVNNLYGMKPHSSLNFVGTTAPIRTLAHWETIHRNALDDVSQLQATINNELLYGLRLAEDAQILNGTGTGEDLLGILNTPGIQGLTRASGDNYADAIRRSMTKAFLAYYEPTGVVVHPTDWEAIELLKTTFGQYILSTNVAIGAVKQVWRLPIVDTPAIAQGTALVGAFGIGAQLYDRMAGNIRIAEQHADLFVRNAVLVLAEERIGLAVKRPESFVKVTF
jgi:hypothetical protein